MAKQTLSEKTVAALPAPARGNRFYRFTGWQYRGRAVPPQFGVVITKAGSRSYALGYSVNGMERRKVIGPLSSWSMEAAVQEAKALRKRIDRGEDPLAEKEAAREAPTVNEMCGRALRDHYSRRASTTYRDAARMIKTTIKPAIGRKKVADVSHADIDRLHASKSATPYEANRVRAVLSKMFNLAIRWGWRADNPCKGVERNPEARRTMYLTPEEIGRLSVALDGYPAARAAKIDPTDAKAAEKMARERLWGRRAADLVRLCLLTGCRRGEALAARWDDMDLDAGEWVKPGSTTKQRTEHRAPLSDAAVALLAGILEAAERDDDGELESPWVFPGKTPATHLSDVKNQWEAIRTAAKLPGVRLHDLRHTFASVLVSAGASLPLIGALLGHNNAQTTMRYAHLYSDPLRQAANTVGAVVTGAKPADVVEIGKGR